MCQGTAAHLLPEISWKYIQPLSELLGETPQPPQKLKTALPRGAAQPPDLSIGSSPRRAAASRDAWSWLVFLSRSSRMGHSRGAPTSHREVIEVVQGAWAGGQLGRTAGRLGTWEWGEIRASRRAAVIFHFSADPQKPVHRSSCRSNTWI